ncbi:unnamed protein product [Rhizophagus irregularis]|nr:unnamed protein product [Rhizophagus irregularis]
MILHPESLHDDIVFVISSRIGIHCPNSSNSFNTINTHSSLFSVIGFIFKCNSVEAAVVDFAEVTNANSSEVDAGFGDEVAPTGKDGKIESKIFQKKCKLSHEFRRRRRTRRRRRKSKDKEEGWKKFKYWDFASFNRSHVISRKKIYKKFFKMQITLIFSAGSSVVFLPV